MKKHSLIAWIISILLLTAFMGNPSLAQEGITGNGDIQKSQVMQEITLQEAIDLTLNNNVDLKLLVQQIEARELDLDKADYYSDKLRDVDERIHDGWKELNQKKQQVEQLKASGMWALMPEEQRKAIEDQIAQAEEELSAGAAYRIDNLANAQVVELYEVKAYLGLEVTQLGVEIAKSQYALLTKQKYYEVLKAQRLLKVKEAAMKRAQSQAKMAKDSWEAGFRPKDDLLMAEAQLSLMKADQVKAANDLKLAEIELKKVMYLEMDQEIKLADDFTTDRHITDLKEGLENTLTNRVEIKKAEMEVKVGEINMRLAKGYTAPNTFAYRQIKIELDNALLGQKKQEQSVRAEVYGDYYTVLAVGTMLDYVGTSVKQAKEALEIAEYRYREGYGIPTSVLKSLNMEDSGGTIFEVLAAQEKLSEIEEKVVEITYGYNLAKSKYDVDTGKSRGTVLSVNF